MYVICLVLNTPLLIQKMLSGYASSFSAMLISHSTSPTHTQFHLETAQCNHSLPRLAFGAQGIHFKEHISGLC